MKDLKLAKGEFIWRHDADDISLPQKLERQIQFMDKHPEFDLCATQIAFMTERGKVAWDKRQPKTPGSKVNPTARSSLKTSAPIHQSHMGPPSSERPYFKRHLNTVRHSSPAKTSTCG